MQKKLKILLIRFSSIGDIVLTSSVVRCIKTQINSEVHFITKNKFRCILEENPYIDKIHTVRESISEVDEDLKLEKYNLIIDLHNNIRSFILRNKLGVNSIVYNKESLRKFLYINFGINLIKNSHIEDRYFKKLEKLGVKNDKKGLDYFISPNLKVNFDFNKKYIVWCIGASKENKKLSAIQISNIISKIDLDIPVLLLGDKNDKTLAEQILSNDNLRNVRSFCGYLNLDESCFLIKNSELVLTNDTGLMHVASAFNKKIISFWGCTKPELGFYPRIEKNKSIVMLANNNRPCSKHGNSCRFFENGCVKTIKEEDIISKIKILLK